MNSLTINWPLLLAAMALLWLPLVWFVGPVLRKKLTFAERNESVTILHLLASPWSWVDLARSGAGAWLLTVLAVRVPETGGSPYPALAIKVVIVAVGTVWQMFATHDVRVRVAPLFYIVGIAAGLAPWPVAVFGGALGLTLAGLIGRPWTAFLLLPVAYAGAAHFFGGLVPLHLVPALLCLLPLAYCVQGERPLSWLATRTTW